MKRVHLFILLFSVISSLCSVSVFASPTGELVTGMRVFDNDTTFRYDYFYDTGGRKVLETNYFQSGNSWTRNRQTEWVYRDGNCVQQIERVFVQNAWRTVFGIDYAYNQSVLSSEIRYQITSQQDTVFCSKSVYSADSRFLSLRRDFIYRNNCWVNTELLATSARAGNKDTTLIILYDAAGNDTTAYRYINSYNLQSVLSNQIQQLRDSDKWVNSEQINWYYKSDGSALSSCRVKKWNSEQAQWENYQRVDYDYDTAGKLVSETALYWYMMFWVYDFRYDYVLDTDGFVLEKNMSVPLYNDWRKLISIGYSNFTNGNARKMESVFDFWGGTSGDKVSSYIPFVFNGEAMIRKAKSIELTYAASDTAQSVNDIKDGLQLKIFPNPSIGMFYIDSFNYTVVSWQVFDLAGRIVRSNNEQMTTAVVDITDLPRGVYLLKAYTPGAVLSQKLIKN